MSKNETPMTEWYWREVLKKGTLIEEYVAVERPDDDSNAPRFMDGLVILDGPFEISDDVRRDIAGKDVVVIQSKSVRSVAVCRKDDKVMRPMLEAHPGIEVVFCPAEIRAEERE
jgi:hypothetical protein